VAREVIPLLIVVRANSSKGNSNSKSYFANHNKDDISDVNKIDPVDEIKIAQTPINANEPSEKRASPVKHTVSGYTTRRGTNVAPYPRPRGKEKED